MTGITPADPVAEPPLITDAAKPPLSLAEHRLKQHHHSAARLIAQRYVDIPEYRVEALLILAKVAEKTKKYTEALELVRQALTAGAKGVKVYSFYLSLAYITDHPISGLQFYSALPAKLRKNPKIRREISWIYEEIGWYASSLGIASKYTWKLRERLRNRMVRPVASLLLRSERAQERDLLEWGQNLEILDSVGFSNPIQMLEFRSEIEVYLARLRRVEALWHLAVELCAGLVSTAAIVTIFALGLSRPLAGPFGSFADIAASSGATVMAGMLGFAGLGLSRRSWLWPSFALWLTIFAAAGVGGVELMRVAPLLGFAVAAGMALAVAVKLTGTLLTLATNYAFRSVRKSHVRAAIADMMLDILHELADDEKRHDTGYQLHWLRALDKAANLVRLVANTVPANDEYTRQWLTARLDGARCSFLQMKRMVLSPSEASLNHLARLSQQHLYAFAKADYGRLPQGKPSEPSKRRTAVLAKVIVRTIVVAGLPAGALFALQPFIGITPAEFGWAKIGTLFWGVLSLLFALDPALREKIETAGQIASTINPLLSRERPDKSAARHEAAASN